MSDMEIAIIGAGIAGLACAKALEAAGRRPVLFDKSRGLGGRLATRRADGGLSFDHGAPHIAGQVPGFAAMLDQARAAGRAALWQDGTGQPQMVGLPGMSAIGKFLGDGLDIRKGVAISAVEAGAKGWCLQTERGALTSARLVLAVPAPQAAVLLGQAHPLTPEIAKAQMAPCLSLMAAFAGAPTAPFQLRRQAEDDLAVIALNSAKPGRAETQCWVAHASPSWSAAHLELEFPQIAALMLPKLCAQIGAQPDQAIHVAAHRWRYARVVTAIGQPFLRDLAGSLYAGGDWCLGADADHAWQSGVAIARDILDHA